MFIASFGFENISLFSNKPFVARRDVLNRLFPQIQFIIGVPKKPYPDGLVALQKNTAAALNEILLVDDRLLTGMLAVCLSGVRGIYIKQPYQDFKVNPMRESFFELLRRAERWVFRS